MVVAVLAVMMLGGQLQAEERDPFVFGPRSPVAAQPAAPTLDGILWDTRRPLAIIGEQTAGVGDTVSGWEVVEIQQHGVVLQRGGRREVVAPGHPIPSE